MKKSAPKFYTITEAAKKLGLTRAAIHAAIKTGRLPAKWGTHTVEVEALLISAKDLNNFEPDKEQKARAKKRFS